MLPRIPSHREQRERSLPPDKPALAFQHQASQKMFEDLHEAFRRGLDQFQLPIAASVTEQRQVPRTTPP